MTDEMYEKLFESLDDSDLLRYIGDKINTVKMDNGEWYHIRNLDDFKAMIDQEMYQELTGRD